MYVSLIIPSYRNPKYLELCLQSAIKYRSMEEESEIIVVLDGYVEESAYVIDKYTDSKNAIRVLNIEQNVGMQAALNYGVMNASGQVVCIINDDNVLCPKWDHIAYSELKELYRLNKYEKLRYVLTLNQIESKQSIFNFNIGYYGDVNNFDFDKFEKDVSRFSKFEYTADGGIFPFVMYKKDYMAVNGFDTYYKSPFVCDWDFFMRLEMLDFGLVRTHSAQIYHFGSTATKFGKDSQAFKESEYLAIRQFEYKWGFSPVLQKNNSHIPTDLRIKGIHFKHKSLEV